MKNALKQLAYRLHTSVDLRDCRGRKVILVPHCVLNQNARVAGAAERPAAFVELVIGLLERDVGILQMPCPELCVFGLDRANVRVESEMRNPVGRSMSRRLARDLVQQVQTYLACGINILGVLGKNGSPSCGVEQTWSGGVCSGSGAFIEDLAAEFHEKNISLEITGIRDSDPVRAIAVVDRWLSMIERP
jgi:predicted secreted protein